MTDVRQKILLLPDFHLKDEDDWVELSKIISCIEDKTLTAIKLYFDSEKFNDPEKISAFTYAWFNMTQSIITWVRQLHEVWLKLNNNALTADDLIPLMSELLPNDEAQLKLMQKNFDLASRITYDSEINYYLISFYVATTAKINEFKEQKQKLEKKILIVVEEMQILHQISLLLPVCINYLTYLENNFILQLQTTYIETYNKCFKLYTDQSKDNGQEKLIDIVIEQQFSKNIAWENASLDLALDRYLILSDIHITLTKENKSAVEKLFEFVMKFNHYSDLLSEDTKSYSFLNKISTGLGINRIYGNNQNIETEFLKMGGFFSQKTSQAEDDKENELAAPLQFAS